MFIKTGASRIFSSLCGSSFILSSTCNQTKYQGEEEAKFSISYTLSNVSDDSNLFNIQNHFVTQNNVSRDRHRFFINPSEFII